MIVNRQNLVQIARGRAFLFSADLSRMWQAGRVPTGVFFDMTERSSQQLAEASIRLLMVDDHAVLRAGLRSLLEGEAASDGRSFVVVAEASTGEEAVQCYEHESPDVTILDLRLPDMTGLDVIRKLRKRDPQAKLLVLSSFDAEEDVAQCLAAGALAYAVKEIPPDDLVQAVSQVAMGRRWLCPSSSSRLAERIMHQPLTEREVEILELTASGLANKEIAYKLRCATGTVKVHLANIYAKLDCDSRTGAVQVARQRGWLHDAK
ncbi:MAG: response regulator transcription factor [Planctomycetota bacterium]